MTRKRPRKSMKSAVLAFAIAGALAAPLLYSPPADAQFNPCVRPQRPLLPFPGSRISESHRNGILLEFSRYFDNLSRYMQCLSNEQEDAKRDYDETIEIYNQFNRGSRN